MPAFSMTHTRYGLQLSVIRAQHNQALKVEELRPVQPVRMEELRALNKVPLAAAGMPQHTERVCACVRAGRLP